MFNMTTGRPPWMRHASGAQGEARWKLQVIDH